MTSSHFHRLSGLGLLVGAIAFVVHIVSRSFTTAGLDASVFAKQGSWVPINALGAVGAALVLLGLPAMYAGVAGPTGLFGLVGVGLLAGAWMFFGVFMSLYATLVLPWLADRAPSLIGASASLPTGIIVAFVVGLAAWLGGAVLFAIPFLRGRARPRWIGYLLPASALWVVVGDLVIAPSGPATNVAVNLLSNLGPVLLLVPFGYLGWRTQARRPTEEI